MNNPGRHNKDSFLDEIIDYDLFIDKLEKSYDVATQL